MICRKTILYLVMLFACLMVADYAGAQNRPGVDGSLSYVLLDPSRDLSSQMKSARTLYEIQGAIDLKGQKLVVPSACVLKFNGGLIKNGSVVFDNTYLDGLVQFSGCSFSGQLYNQDVTLSWFGASPSNSDNSTIINEVAAVSRAVVIVDAV